MSIGNIYDAVFLFMLVAGFLYGMGLFVSEVRQNTKATAKLNSTMETFSKETVEKISNHETRITVLESRNKK